jgi:hypothetical protein
LFQQAAQSQEVAVPAPILEHGQHKPSPACVLVERSPFVGACGERLVDDHRQSGIESGRGEQDMSSVGRSHHHEVEVVRFSPDLVCSPEERDAGMVSQRSGAALLVPRDDCS